jgi:hypothetical protein
MSFNININSESIKKFFKNNYQLILVVLTIIFLYFLFYTDYIVNNNNKTSKKVSETIIEMPTQTVSLQITEKPTQQLIQQINQSNQQQMQSTNQAKQVRFDINQNQEILYETKTGRINIDYNAPEISHLQKISNCTYPMNTAEQLNMRDCSITGSCLTSTPRRWFEKQREAKHDLPGFNGYNLAQFSFPQNTENDMMMRNMIHDNNSHDNNNSHNKNNNTENFNNNYDPYNPIQNTYDQVNAPKIMYHNAPFDESPELRGALPNDLCRSCTVAYQ